MIKKLSLQFKFEFDRQFTSFCVDIKISAILKFFQSDEINRTRVIL